MFYRRELWVVLTVGALIALLGLMESTNDAFNIFKTTITIESPTQASMLYGASTGTLLLCLLPLLATFPCACFFFEEYKSGSIVLYISRAKPILYYYSKTIVIAVTAFLVSILPYVLNLLFCLLAYPFPQGGVFSEEAYNPVAIATAIDRTLFTSLYLNHPLWDAFAHIFFVGIFGMVMALLSYSITLFFRKNLLVALCTTTLLGLAQILIVTSFRLYNWGIHDYFLLIPLVENITIAPLLIELTVLLGISVSLIALKLKRFKDIVA
jgi:hypothetical protein